MRTKLGPLLLPLLFTALPALAQSTDVRQATDDGTCLLKPRQVVQLGSSIAGLLVEETVDRGDAVQRGQLVARLDSSVEEATLALDRYRATNDAAIKVEQVDMEMNQRMLDRKKQLVDKQYAKSDFLEEYQTKVAEGKLKIRQAEMDQRVNQLTADRSQKLLEQRQVHSTLDGVVIERKLSPGEYVYEQTPIMMIAQIDPLNVELVLPADRYGSITVGTVAQIRPLGPIKATLEATVEVIDPVIDAASNTFGVRLVLPNPGNAIPAGLRCSVVWPMSAAAKTP